jgi:very-short-patch-repair endonuclease
VEHLSRVVTRAQLVAHGVGPATVERAMRDRRLLRIHRGVYAFGHRALRPEGWWMAAVLACGEGAVLSHRSAAVAWTLLKPADGRIEVTSPRAGGAALRSVRAHHGDLAPADATARHRIPITTVARTLLDIAETGTSRELDLAIDEAIRLRRFRWRDLDELRARAHGRRGLKPLAAALQALEPARTRTKSELEREGLSLIHAFALPPGEVNRRLLGYEVDLLWREHRLVVELDSHAFHSTPAEFERNRRRYADLQAAGFRVLRFTWRQVIGQPGWVADRIRMVLRA